MTLYEFAPTRSIRVRWTLQELGVDFDAVAVDLLAGAHQRLGGRVRLAGPLPGAARLRATDVRASASGTADRRCVRDHQPAAAERITVPSLKSVTKVAPAAGGRIRATGARPSDDWRPMSDAFRRRSRRGGHVRISQRVRASEPALARHDSGRRLAPLLRSRTAWPRRRTTARRSR